MAYSGPSVNLELNQQLQIATLPFAHSADTGGEPTTTFLGTDSGLHVLEFGNASQVFDVGIGELSLSEAHGSTLGSNVALGPHSLVNITGGYGNVAIGPMGAGFLGAGYAYIGENSNLVLYNVGQAGDTNTIRIGTQGSADLQQNKCFIAGVYNTAIGATTQPLIIDNNGQMGGTNNLSIPGNLLLPNTNSAGTQGVIEFNSIRFIHNVGTDNTFIGQGSGNLSVTGTKNSSLGFGSLTATVAGHDLIAIGYQSLNSIGSSAASIIAIGNSTGGTSTGNGNIYLGHAAGSNYTGTENNNILIGNTGTLGDTGQIYLGTQGTHTDATIPAILHTNGLTLDDSNGTTPGQGFISIFNPPNGTYVPFLGSPGIEGVNGATNIVLGVAATSLSYDSYTLSGVNNTAIGCFSSGIGSNNNNTLIGFGAAPNLASGDNNTIIGSLALSGDAGDAGTAANNIALGYQAASNYQSSESSNIIIGNTGTTGDNNIIRIGTQGSGAQQQNLCFIAGIFGSSVGASHTPVLIDNTGALGTIISSQRFKNSIEDMGEKSNPLLNLRPVNFIYNHDKTQQLQWGLIAEEVEQVMPSLVTYDEEGKPYTVKYHDLPALLLNELQQQRKLINKLVQQVAQLTGEIDGL